jgi:hypothetical protein
MTTWLGRITRTVYDADNNVLAARGTVVLVTDDAVEGLSTECDGWVFPLDPEDVERIEAIETA